MATQTKQFVFLTAFALALFTFGAKSQAQFAIFQTYRVVPPKLTVLDIRKISGSNWIVRLSLTRNGNPTVDFDLNINDATTKDDVYAKLKPAVDQLANDLEAASTNIQPH
jgi:hypothetical protein